MIEKKWLISSLKLGHSFIEKEFILFFIQFNNNRVASWLKLLSGNKEKNAQKSFIAFIFLVNISKYLCWILLKYVYILLSCIILIRGESFVAIFIPSKIYISFSFIFISISVV